MENKCKRLAAFPTNHAHKALVSLNYQTFYGTGSLTIYNGLYKVINLSFNDFLGKFSSGMFKKEQFKEGERLEKEIKQNLKRIGWEI